MAKIFICFMLSLTLGNTVMEKRLPVVKTEKEFMENTDKKVILVGTYTGMMLPKSKRPGSPMIKTDRVSIGLGDFEVALETGDTGYRSKEEREKYAGKKVKVTGTIYKTLTLWGNGEEQSIVMPAIKDIKLIELAE